MNPIDAGTLSEAQETLLIPLWARAVESQRAAPILVDRKAIELVESLAYPFERFARAKVDSAGFCIRGRIIDALVKRFLEEHAAGMVVEMGAGLDTRFDRLDNGTVSWVEVDLPEAMALRRRLFDETPRRRQLSSSVLDAAWLDGLAATDPSQTLFVAEGMLYFLDEQQIRVLFRCLADRFPGTAVVFDCQSPLFLRYNNWRQPVRNAKLLWSVRRARDLEAWDPRFRVEEYVGFGDRPYYSPDLLARLPFHQRLARRLWPPSRHMFKICRLRLEAAKRADSASVKTGDAG
jgi:O-methyltransferase involved in polyketide biosynthesis